MLPESSDISRAFERPREPFRDSIGGDHARIEEVRIGYLIFTETPKFLGPMVASEMSCTNCHLNAGQRLGALPLVGVTRAYPAPSVRAGRVITLEDRIVGCLLRSINVAGGSIPPGRIPHENAGEATFPSPRSFEVRAVAAYLGWIGDGVDPGAFRERESIPHARRLPLAQLDVRRGEALYVQKCQTCHGEDGQGMHLGRLKAGPLWGARSWNDGAGFARTYTLAGFLRRTMPYSTPGSLGDDDAQHIAAFITSKPRPSFPEKARDYPGATWPVDAVYYRPSSTPR